MANPADTGPTGLSPSEIDLHLLREWREPMTARRVVVALVVSAFYHVLIIGSLVLAPDIERVETAPIPLADIRKAVPLYVPQDLMQRDPNKGKITHMLDVRSAAAPAAVAQAPRFRRPQPRPLDIVTPAVVPPVVPEPPKIEAEAAPAPPPLPEGRLPPVAAPAPPEKPKLAFESVGAAGTAPRTPYNPNASAKVPDPRVVAENALRPPSAQPGQGSPGVVVGDVDEMNSAASPDQAAVPGPVRSNLQLLSDPKGFDFKPYLIQVLTAVRRNWLAVIPESARLGRKGRVLVQFIIDKRGGIPKLVIAESSGAAALDRAAVAGISASSPLPPLPSGFNGNEIRLQLAFAYNQPAGR